MQLHDPTLHQKLIEMCDCYLDTDFPAQLRQAAAAKGSDSQEEALKYLALALLHGLTLRAEKLSFKRRKNDLSVTVSADGEKNSLPAPSPAMFAKIIALMRAILHSEAAKEKTDLALGLRSGEVELQVKVEEEGDKESLKIKFPKN